MKKEYKQPVAQQIEVHSNTLMKGSIVVSSSRGHAGSQQDGGRREQGNDWDQIWN